MNKYLMFFLYSVLNKTNNKNRNFKTTTLVVKIEAGRGAL